MPRLLFVEDEEEVLRTVQTFFKRQGFDVYGARTGREALELADRYLPDVAVLDVMLQEGPEGSDGMDGFDICKALREQKFRGPVIFLTARTSEQDKLTGFELGADDYVTKPFSMMELMARINAALRRAGGARSVFRFGEVEVDLDNYVIRRAGVEERLSNREQELLRFLIEHRGQVLPREVLLTSIWQYNPNVTTRTVDTHILNVRKKLGDDAQSPRFIETMHGVGYRFIADEG
ncbi:MAG: response regulator transcription factor [Alphaproteobacteria bacterium]|nr:response regulator transcription factor [Alphaproteobacteria bacterium]MCB9794444.1 response regulator transcription factor [Alphaproteobacteria bacterium]